jgi:hypothetical protein
MIVQVTLTSVGGNISDNLNITADIGSVNPSTASNYQWCKYNKNI